MLAVCRLITLALLTNAQADAWTLAQWLTPLDVPTAPAHSRVAGRPRPVRIDPAPLLAAEIGDVIPFHLAPDDVLLGRVRYSQRHGPGRIALGGELVGDATSHFTLVLRDGLVAATIAPTDRNPISIRPVSASTHVLLESPPIETPECEIGLTGAPLIDPDVQSPDPASRGTCADDAGTIDIMIVYTPNLREAAGGTAAIETIADLFVAYMNQAMANSLVSPRMNLVHTYETDYAEEIPLAIFTLLALRDRDDGILDEVHFLRDLYGADLVCLLVTGYSGGGPAGYAFNPGPWTTHAWYQGGPVGQGVFAHEVGHNLGCGHQRFGTDDTGIFSYSHALRFVGQSGRAWHTILAGASAPHYSNPDVLFDGVPTGIHFEAPDSADNTRTINETALHNANRRLSDCNCNGARDVFDLQDATSNDCNGSGIPDECESDCNGNALADECDLDAPAATLYRNAEIPGNEAFLPTGAPLADDLHLATPGALTGFSLAYYAPNSFTEPLRLTVNVYATDGGLSSVPPDNLIASYASTALPIGRRTYARALDEPLSLPQDIWLEVQFNDPTASVVFAPPNPETGVGTSADLLYARLGIPELAVPPGFHTLGGAVPANFAVTLDGLAAPVSLDCNANAVPDECDIAAGLSGDCQPNGIPDDCEPDCNANGRADECDVADATSVDCQSDGIPDECQVRGPVLAADFDHGLPQGWTATGLWHVTTGCAQPDPCGAPGWAYFGRTGLCDLDAGRIAGALTAPIIYQPPDAPISVEYCSVYRGESGTSNVTGFDWAWLSANGVQIEDVSITGDRSAWEQRAVPIASFPGGALQVAWHFDTRDDLLNTELGWQIDTVRIIGSLDCNLNGIPDDCDIAGAASADCNENLVPDECELLLGDSVDTNGNGILDVCEVITCVCGDLNLDGRIDMSDFESFTTCFDRRTPDTTCPIDRFPCADLDADGWVSLNDYATFVILFATDPAAAPPDCLTGK